MLKIEISTRGTNSMPFVVFRCDHLRSVHQGSFAVRNHFRSGDHLPSAFVALCSILGSISAPMLGVRNKIVLKWFQYEHCDRSCMGFHVYLTTCLSFWENVWNRKRKTLHVWQRETKIKVSLMQNWSSSTFAFTFSIEKPFNTAVRSSQMF